MTGYYKEETMRNDSIYIKLNENESLIHTSGVTFRDFAEGISLYDKGLLILAGFPDHCKFNMNLLLEYVPQDQMKDIVKENVYHYGDFCWVDFQNEEQLDQVSSEELAQMLYMSHMKKPFENFIINSLKNRYAYLCHDDGWWNNVYMEDVTEYKKIISHLLMKELKGRKRTINAPDPDLLSGIFGMCRDGLIIDFEKKASDGVSLFCVGAIETMDELESKIDRYRNKTSGLYVYYNPRKKSWESF